MDWLGTLFHRIADNIGNSKAHYTVSLNGQDYEVKKDNAGYYLSNGFYNLGYLTNDYVKEHIKELENTNKTYWRTISNADINKNTTVPKNTNTTNTNEEPTDKGSGAGPITYTTPVAYNYNNDAKLKEYEQRIYELEHPRVYSADEIAEHYGIKDQYNEQYWLDLLNKETNDYYNAAIDEQSKLRSQYLRNNNQYLNNIVGNYLDSYRNAAPTATGRGALAANILNTTLTGGVTNATNDYGMLQSINALDEARKQELANNPNSARQRYNTLGTYLSDVSVTKHKDDVDQYIAGLKALASDYAADRSYQSYLAQAAGAKYAGLAQAASTNAGTKYNTYNSNAAAFQRLYDYYREFTNTDKEAASYVANALNSAQGKGQG